MTVQLPWGPVLGRPGALCVTPGNVESVPEQAANNGFAWLALNVGDHAPGDWDLVRERCKRFGLTVYPWARLHKPNMQDIACMTARSWRTRPLLNIESEAKNPTHPDSRPWGQPAFVAAKLRKDYPKIQAILSIPGWPYWGGTDWSPLRDNAALLQILPEDMHIANTKEEIARVQRDCETMARRVFKRVGVSYQSYRDLSPLLFDRRRTGWSVIWGDTVNDWRAWGTV